MHVEAKLCKLQNRRTQHVFNFMLKKNVTKTLLMIEISELDAILFNTNIPKWEKYKHNIFYYGARLWNQLPVKERRIDDYKTFKNVQKSKKF